jgi:hypothetical protein
MAFASSTNLIHHHELPSTLGLSLDSLGDIRALGGIRAHVCAAQPSIRPRWLRQSGGGAGDRDTQHPSCLGLQ